VYCRRQWALIHVEHQWGENEYTIYGQIIHENTHNPLYTEKRGDLIITRNMPVVSYNLGLYGICDVVEFYYDVNGIHLFGRERTWLPIPVEYKSGNVKIHDADRLQLCAQALCLEEMLACPTIHEAFIFYNKPRRREKVPLSDELRDAVKKHVIEMHGFFKKSYTPRVKPMRACFSCSLKHICVPKLPHSHSVSSYISNTLNEDLDN